MEFFLQNRNQFWIKRTLASSQVVKEVRKPLISVATSYWCELDFSPLVSIKTKWRNRLELKKIYHRLYPK